MGAPRREGEPGEGCVRVPRAETKYIDLNKHYPLIKFRHTVLCKGTLFFYYKFILFVCFFTKARRNNYKILGKHPRSSRTLRSLPRLPRQTEKKVITAPAAAPVHAPPPPRVEPIAGWRSPSCAGC